VASAPRLLLSRLLVAAAAVLGLSATVVAVVDGVDQWQAALGFTALVLVGELLRVNLPGDRDAAPLGGAGALAFAVLTELGDGTRATHGVADVVAVVFAGCVLAGLIHSAGQRTPRWPDMASRLFATTVAALLFMDWLRLDLASIRVRDSDAPVLAMVVAVFAGGAVDVLIAAALRAYRERTPLVPALRNEITAQAAIGTAMAATGILIALAVPTMGLWALLVFCVPLLVTQFSFRRYASISATYRQTIRALSRVTEVSGHVEPGHSRRVMLLSTQIGREFGMTESELLDLEYAALLHDIGQLSLADPIPRGSTLTVAPSERRRIAELGAAVVRSTGNLDTVAHVVECQANAYRKMRETVDVDVPVAARIVKVVSAYDDLVSASREQRGPRAAWDALERLRMGMAFEYDPRVVEALTRVLTKNGDV
jgi:hypothetical protein